MAPVRHHDDLDRAVDACRRARYGPQRSLVGPEMYPLYALAVKVLLAIVLISVSIAGVVRILVVGGDPGAGIGRMLGQLFSGTISVVGVMIFAGSVRRSRCSRAVIARPARTACHVPT